jgi:hypothetical protein
MSSQKKNTSKLKIDNKVLLAIIGVAGTICAALITAVFGFLSIKTQVEAPIKATQTSEALMQIATPTTSAPLTGLDWNSIATIKHLPICDLRVLPNNIDLSDNQAGKQLASTYNSGGTLFWAEIPEVMDPESGNSASTIFDIASTADKSWIELSKTVNVSVEVEETIPDVVDVLVPMGCGGGGEIRIFPSVSLENSFPQFTTETNFADVDFFTLEPGEFERFRIPFECKVPGFYRLKLTIPFRYEGENGTMETSTMVMCPQSTTLWLLDVPSGTMVGTENYVWDNSTYSKVP